MNPVAVVIPIYKSDFTVHEQIAFRQCLKVLGQHPIKIVKPISLDIASILAEHPHLEVENFDDRYFLSVRTYNKLVLWSGFYERFADYQYILIYQLDAFVFRDNLLEWCAKGYDYIGAPWRIERDFSSLADKVLFNIKKQMALWLNLKDKNQQPLNVVLKMTVGNGGFSLRKISKMIEVLRNNQSKIDQYLSGEGCFYNEDIFFCIEMNRYSKQVSLPHWRDALRFAVEDSPTKAYRLNDNTLPFGCHAWDIHELDFWKPHFEQFGHSFEI